MKVAIAEDLLMFRELIVKVCSRSGHEVVGDTWSGREIVDIARNAAPDAVIADIGLPELNGLAALQAIRSESPSIKVLVISFHLEPYLVHSLDRLPLDGYIDKRSELITAVPEALAAVAHSTRWFSPSYLQARQDLRHDCNSFVRLLSTWEQEILAMIGQEMPSAEISAKLKISRRTLEGHRSRIARKLSLAETSRLASYSRDQGFTLHAQQ